MTRTYILNRSRPDFPLFVKLGITDGEVTSCELYASRESAESTDYRTAAQGCIAEDCFGGFSREVQGSLLDETVRLDRERIRNEALADCPPAIREELDLANALILGKAFDSIFGAFQR